MIIGQVLDKFMPIIATWMYSQIDSLRKMGVQSKVFCHKTLNLDIYKHKPIFSFKDTSKAKENLFGKLATEKNEDAATLYWNEILQKEKVDLIHSHSGLMAMKGIDLALKNNLPHLVTFYGADTTRDPFGNSPLQRQYQKKLPLIFKKSNLILCTSRFLKKSLVKIGAPAYKIKVWHLGIDLNLFKKGTKKNDKFKIISCGRFKEWKGQKYLILALLRLLKKYKNIEVVFTGTGEKLDQCKKLVKKLGLERYVNFKGELPKHSQVAKEMASSHIIVHSSFTGRNKANDALGMVLVEAGACEVPAVASRSGGIPEAVIDKKTGFLVEPKNPKQIAEKIILLMENESLRKKMGQEARKYVQKEFDLSKQIRKLKKIYQKVIRK